MSQSSEIKIIDITRIDKDLINELHLKTVNDLLAGNYSSIVIIVIEDGKLKLHSILNAQVIEVTKNKILKPNEHIRRQILLKSKEKIIKEHATGKEYAGNIVVWKSFGYEKINTFPKSRLR